MQAMACSACICVGVHRITASTSGSQAFGQIGCHMLDAVFVGHFLGLVKARPIRETTSTPSMFLMPSRCLMPKAPRQPALL
jgi:hypothetical protein